MKPIPGLRRLFRLSAGRSTAAADVADELALHLSLATDELIAEGMAPDLARAEALRRFGNLSDIQRTVTAIDREQERAVRRSEWLDSLIGDFRHALRGLRRSPGFALGTALTLGLGIGLNTAIFSVFDAVLLRPLPFAEPGQLVRVWSSKPDRGLARFSVSVPDFEDWKQQSKSFDRLATFQRQQDLTLTGLAEPERVQGSRVSADLFGLLGVKPALGRLFGAEEDRPGAADRPLLLSHPLWLRRFGGDSSILGRAISLGGEPWTVVGVMPEDFFVPGTPAELWMPMGTDPGRDDRGDRHLRVLGRLAPGVTPEAGLRELGTIARRLESQFPASNTGWTVALLSMADAVMGEEFRDAVKILFGAVGIVLLIACVNVATMVLGRSAARGRELAVRTALGAGSRRLGRLLLAEGLVLGVAGGVIGLILAFALVRLLHGVAPANLPRLDQVRVNGVVLGVAALLAVGCGVVFGLVPLARASRIQLAQSLREGGRGVTGGRARHRTQRTLVVAEVTLAVLLLSGAGLLIRSLARLQQVETGFLAPRTLAVDLALPPAYQGSRRSAFFAELLDRVRSLPGVRAASAISSIPLGGVNSGTAFVVDGRPLPDPKNVPDADYRIVTPGYFRHLSIPLLEGRDFTERDDSAGERVVIVSADLAARFFPGQDPLGARLRLGDVVRGPLVQVVGVVGDVRHLSLESPEQRPMMYFPERRAESPTLTVLVTTSADPAAIAPLVRREVHLMDAGLPVGAVRTMDEVIDAAFAQRRFNVVVLGVFAAAALVLAGIGLYGVMAYAVSQRTHELGVRLALGAQRSAVVGMVLGESLRLVAGGVVLGLGGALLLNKTLSSLLFQVRPNDPVTLIGASVLLAGIALLGSLVPARRAARVDPMTTLRQE